MLTINAEISEMSEGEREALSTFILTYPQIDRRVSLQALLPDAVERRQPVPESDEPSPEQAFASGPVLVQAESSPSTLDKSGLPWDERIHSSSKALTADGLWRKKRGVEDSLVSQVEAQLKQLMGLPAPQVAAVDPAPVVPAAPIAVPPPPPAAEVAPVVTDGKQAFINLISRISTAIQGGKLTQDEVQAACVRWGVEKLPLLAHRPDLIASVAMDIEALIISR